MIVVYVLTAAGPATATQVLSTLAFFKGIDGGDLAGGAAIALFLFPVLAACRDSDPPVGPAGGGGHDGGRARGTITRRGPAGSTSA